MGGCSKRLALRPQLAHLLLQVPEILRSGDLSHLARPLRLIHLDPQLVHLPLQALFASANLARHPLEYACQSA
jgi:hypothetical protein